MPHRNARLTVYARALIVERRAVGWTQARTAEQLGVSRGTVSKWLARYDAEGPAGLEDRSSRPCSTPTRVSDEVEARVLELRRGSHRGAVFLAGELGLVASTVGRILARHQVPALAAVDAVTGAPVRRRRGGPRYERRRPGELLHVDVKKLGRVPDGGGWRLHGRSVAVRRRGNGYDFLHVAVDDHSSGPCSRRRRRGSSAPPAASCSVRCWATRGPGPRRAVRRLLRDAAVGDVATMAVLRGWARPVAAAVLGGAITLALLPWLRWAFRSWRRRWRAWSGRRAGECRVGRGRRAGRGDR